MEKIKKGVSVIPKRDYNKSHDADLFLIQFHQTSSIESGSSECTK